MNDEIQKFLWNNVNRYDFELDDGGAGKGNREKRKSRWGDPKVGLEALTECIQGFQISKSGSAIKKKFFAAPGTDSCITSCFVQWYLGALYVYKKACNKS